MVSKSLLGLKWPWPVALGGVINLTFDYRCLPLLYSSQLNLNGRVKTWQARRQKRAQAIQSLTWAVAKVIPTSCTEVSWMHQQDRRSAPQPICTNWQWPEVSIFLFQLLPTKFNQWNSNIFIQLNRNGYLKLICRQNQIYFKWSQQPAF